MANHIKIDINTGLLAAHTNRLQKMHRSALPVAVRGALNNAAFDVKKDTMPQSAKDEFTQRKPNFFKATSKVEPAKGFALPQMKATVGFVGDDQAVEDLQQQEKGGSIKGRAFIPLNQARTGGSWNKSVRSSARISDIRKGRIVDAKAGTGKNKKEQFIKSAVFAGKGGYLIGNSVKGGNKFLFQVRSLKRIKGRMMVKTVPLFAVKKNRKVNPKATRFMAKATEKSAAKLERFYIEQAQKQIQKLK